MLSKRLNGIEESATIKMGHLAKQLQEEGKDVLNFSLGEPDFKTPDHICEAAKKALDLGYTHYTSSAGIMELREEISIYGWMNHQNFTALVIDGFDTMLNSFQSLLQTNMEKNLPVTL